MFEVDDWARIVARFVLALMILNVAIVLVSKAFIFKKANMKPDMAFTPFYRDFLFASIATGKSAAINIIISIVKNICVIYIVIFFSLNTFFDVVELIAFFIQYHVGAILLYIMFIIYYFTLWWPLAFSFLAYLIIKPIMLFSLVHKFGKSPHFATGLIFLPFIFYPILAFDKSEYNKELKSEIINQDKNNINLQK